MTITRAAFQVYQATPEEFIQETQEAFQIVPGAAAGTESDAEILSITSLNMQNSLTVFGKRAIGSVGDIICACHIGQRRNLREITALFHEMLQGHITALESPWNPQVPWEFIIVSNMLTLEDITEDGQVSVIEPGLITDVRSIIERVFDCSSVTFVPLKTPHYISINLQRRDGTIIYCEHSKRDAVTRIPQAPSS